jgi:hypothetical protein
MIDAKRSEVLRGQGDKILPYINEFLFEAEPLIQVLGAMEGKPTLKAENLDMHIHRSRINIQHIAPPS